MESGNESAPEQLSRENSAIGFSHKNDQTQKTSAVMESDNQYKVYFYDTKDSSENISSSTGAIPNSECIQGIPLDTGKVGDVSGFITIGKSSLFVGTTS